MYFRPEMAGATALHVVSGCGVFFPVFVSRSYMFTGFGRNLPAASSSTRNLVTFEPTRRCQTQALLLEPSDGAQENLDDFVKRMEQTWSITKVDTHADFKFLSNPGRCSASGKVDCPWCNANGFFTIGDNVLCEVPSQNTTCRVCFGRLCGSSMIPVKCYGTLCHLAKMLDIPQCTLPCDDCKGTGFRAKWLGDPQKPNKKDV